VVTIDKNEKEVDTVEDSARVMVFDLDDLEHKEGSDKPSSSRQPSLPLLEQPAARPNRVRRPRPQTNTAIDTFNSIRPSSLPPPSHIRPMRSQPGVDSSSSQGMMMSLPRAPAVVKASQASSSSSQVPLNEHDAELLKLVAADTPSHRGAWTPESKAWQSFTRRQDQRDGVDNDRISEEGSPQDAVVSSAPVSAKKPETRRHADNSDEEDDDDEQPSGHDVAASLPVDIINRFKPREQLSLSSYRPQNALPTLLEQEAVATTSTAALTGKTPSSTAIRKAAYAERDRARSLDPGPLDFAAEEDEDAAEDEDDEESANADDAGEKARKRALRILQARSELPEEGMWRSLV